MRTGREVGRGRKPRGMPWMLLIERGLGNE